MTRQQLHKALQTKLQGLPNAHEDARQILMLVCSCSHTELIAHPSVNTTFTQRVRAHWLTYKRRRGIPMAYLMGKREFYGRPFFVNRHTLVPRPESEQLIDIALKLASDTTHFIDVGTGSGALGITLALETHRPVIAIDKFEPTARVARKNSHQLASKQNIQVRVGHLVDPIRSDEYHKVDHVVIVANLPYLSDNMLEESPNEVKAYEPKNALTADAVDGLDTYREFLFQIAERRATFPKKLDILIEIDPRQKSLIGRMVKHRLGNTPIQIYDDLAGLARIVHIEASQ